MLRISRPFCLNRKDDKQINENAVINTILHMILAWICPKILIMRFWFIGSHVEELSGLQQL